VDRSSTPASFLAEYDAVLTGWPVTVEQIELRSRYGTTRINACGPPGRPPLVLLSGGGAPSAVWFANIGELSRTHRIYAIDALGDRGRSVYDGDPITGRADLMEWLDSCLDGLGVPRADICAHSYGGWIALRYALHAPQRAARLVLLDPTQCFSGQRLTYRLHAIPLFVRPGPGSRRRFFIWETAGAIDPTLLALLCLPFSAKSPRGARFVWPKRPADAELRALATPVLVLLAENGRQNDLRRLSANAHRLVPHVSTSVLPGATHHTMPAGPAAELNRHLTAFLA
jgi:pimeloyl-ACP methyl ester carboxylesterase